MGLLSEKQSILCAVFFYYYYFFKLENTLYRYNYYSRQLQESTD